MNIDLNKYKLSLPLVKSFLENNKNIDRLELASTIAVSTHVPLIVVYYYIAFFEGMSDNMKEGIERVIKFYNYEKIEGIEDYERKQE